jgi:hypothetical protein
MSAATIFAGVLAFPGTSYSDNTEAFSIGPWRLGMSPDQVQSFSDFGPYKPVRVTGGLETSNAEFEGERTNVSFVFDRSGLQYIQVWCYEGKDDKAAQDAVLKLYTLFANNFDGAEIINVDEDGERFLSEGALRAVAGQTLGTAKQLAETTRVDIGQNMQFFFDMMPKTQPPGSILHSRWGYIGKYDTFYVFLFQHREDSPPKMLEANVQVGDL